MLERAPVGLASGCLFLGLLTVEAARAYGPAGHLIAGRAAAPLLCERAAAAVEELGGGEDLGELGLWADRIRGDAAYADTGPWHYMNIADGVPLRSYAHPPEGDVLWAIEHFRGRLADPRLGYRERGEALRFLAHFVVDLHQPLHVGRAEDRGGNAVELRFRGETTNLHRLWDTHAIEWAGLPIEAFVARLAGELRLRGDTAERAGELRLRGDTAERAAVLEPRVWAEESLALRDAVYAIGPARAPPPAYLDLAAETTRERLRLAALRLAGALNRIFCV